MVKHSQYVDYVLDQLEGIGHLSVKSMFGAMGLYHEDLMFGIIEKDVLYFKVNAVSVRRYQEYRCNPFEYTRAGKICQLKYYQVPDAVMDEAEQLKAWAIEAMHVARQARR